MKIGLEKILFSEVPKTSSKNKFISLNLYKNEIKIKTIKIAKSIILSKMIVPKSLSSGIFSTCCKLVHLDISPALGINMFVR